MILARLRRIWMPQESGVPFIVSAGLILLALYSLSGWFDRPQTVAAAGFRGEGPCSMREINVIPRGLSILTHVWVAQSASLGTAPARLIGHDLPIGRDLAIGIAGPLRDPVKIRVIGGVGGETSRDELTVSATTNDWQTIRLPRLNAEGQELAFAVTLSSPQDKLQLSKPFFIDPSHLVVARTVGRLATVGLAAAWILLPATVFGVLILIRLPTFKCDHLVLVSWFLVAVTGYLIFWAYFAHPRLGDAFWCALLVLAAGIAVRRWKIVRELWSRPDWWRVWTVTLGIGLLYFGFLHTWTIDAPWSWLAANRYNANLPADNVLPQIFSDILLHGKSPRDVEFDWVSSDRPPLQSGWVLLLGPLLRTNEYHFDALAQAMGFWFQLLWVPVLAAFFARFGVSLRRGLLLCCVVGLSAFVVINTQFVWPKLGGAAFVLGAWVLGGACKSPRWLAVYGLAGLGLALGLMSHGGTAFSVLGLAPFWLWPYRRGDWRRHLTVALVVAAVCAPWSAYQRSYQPPGNHLLKWHLAGVIPIDERSTWDTLCDSYRGKSIRELWAIRRANVHFAFVQGDWSQLLNFSSESPQPRRGSDSIHLLRSVGWWNVGLVLSPLIWLMGRRRLHPRVMRRDREIGIDFPLGKTLGWIGFTLVLWIMLMFEWHGTFMHQGSYVPPLVLIGLGVLSLYALHPSLLLVALVPAAFYFAVLYGFSEPTAFFTTLNGCAIAVSLAGAAIAGIGILRHGDDGRAARAIAQQTVCSGGQPLR